MHHFKQDEVAAETVIQMSVALCAECPESVACKRYMQWVRLNAPGSTNDNGLTTLSESIPFDRTFYDSRPEEIFW